MAQTLTTPQPMIITKAAPRIAVVIHRRDSIDAAPYLITLLAEAWREHGMKVTVVNGPQERIEADIAILHVDTTRVPADHAAFVSAFPVTVNARITDISKRRISSNLVRRGDGYQGPVIVKTNHNCGGLREVVLDAQQSLARRCVHAVRNRMHWSLRSRIPTGQYRVLDSVDAVPRAVWHNPSLIVEKFLSERRGEHYCLRTWLFLGDREAHSLSYSEEPVIKSRNVVKREVLDSAPDELRRIRADMGFDYGKFDYAIVDGQMVLYDVNRTPTLGHFSREQYMPRARVLAEGIKAFM